MKSSMTDFTTAVYEDNGGGLHAIVSSGDTVINVLSGFEDAGLSTSEFINAAQSGFADADAYDPSNYSGISLGAAAAEFAELDDIIAIITSTDVALYPENMGCAGKNLFSVKGDATMANINRAQERVYWGEDNGDGEYLFVLGANDEMLWAAGYNYTDRANELRDLNEYKKPDADLTGWAYGYLNDLTMAMDTLDELRESSECRVVFLGHYTDDVVGKLEAIFA